MIVSIVVTPLHWLYRHLFVWLLNVWPSPRGRHRARPGVTLSLPASKPLLAIEAAPVSAEPQTDYVPRHGLLESVG